MKACWAEQKKEYLDNSKIEKRFKFRKLENSRAMSQQNNNSKKE